MLVCLGLEPGDFVLLVGQQSPQPLELGLVPGGLGLPDLLRGGVPFGQGRFCGGDARAPLGVDRQDIGRHRRQPAARQHGVEALRVIADEADVVHRSGSPGA